MDCCISTWTPVSRENTGCFAKKIANESSNLVSETECDVIELLEV